MIRWVRPSNLSPCLTPFGKYTQGFVCLNLIYKSSLWLTECVLSHPVGGLLGAHPHTHTHTHLWPSKASPSAGGMICNRTTCLPPVRHRNTSRPSFDFVVLLHHPALDVLQPRPVDTHAESERGLGVWVASGAMLLAERDQNVHGHVSYEIVECVSLTRKRRNPFPVCRWVLCRIWIWSWIIVNRAGKSSRNIRSPIERLVGNLEESCI